MKKHDFWEGIWETTCYDKNGNIRWQELGRINALVDEGEKSMLETYFRSQNVPSTFYMRLCNDTLSETDTLADVQNEPSGNGYSPQEIERSTIGFPTLEINAGDWRTISKDITFTASGGDIGPVNTQYLATTSNNTGLLIAFVTLSITRTILNGDSAVTRFRIKLK